LIVVFNVDGNIFFCHIFSDLPGSGVNKKDEGDWDGIVFDRGPFSYPEPFLRAVRRGALAKSKTGYHKNMVKEYMRY
jgi:hypothetical protein